MERLLNAPVEKVWKALTDKEQMKQWYFDVSAFEPTPGFEFSFEGGGEALTYLHLCKIIEVEPNRKLSYSWRYDGYEGNSILSFELFPTEDGKTKLILTHEGLGPFPALRDFGKENFIAGWTEIFGKSLPKFVEI